MNAKSFLNVMLLMAAEYGYRPFEEPKKKPQSEEKKNAKLLKAQEKRGRKNRRKQND